MHLALEEGEFGTSNYDRLNEKPGFHKGGLYRGYHETDCGYCCYYDYLLENGMITNELAEYYVRYYRRAIPKTEMQKVLQLVEYYKNKYKDKPDLIKNIKLEKINKIYHNHQYDKLFNFLLRILKKQNH